MLVRQLQEQHYHQYMQQLQQNYEPGKELEITTNSVTIPEDIEHESICNEQCENGRCLSGECMFYITYINFWYFCYTHDSLCLYIIILVDR